MWRHCDYVATANCCSFACDPVVIARRPPPNEHRTQYIHDGVAKGSCIAASIVCWMPILPLATAGLDRWMSAGGWHSQWHVPMRHCCKLKTKPTLFCDPWQAKLTFSTHHNSVLCNCCLASPNASDAATTSRKGSISNCDPMDCVWHSAMLRSPSTHSWRARALMARNLRISPEAQLMVNVRESSSLGHTTAPAKCSCHRGELPTTGWAESSTVVSHK